MAGLIRYAPGTARFRSSLSLCIGLAVAGGSCGLPAVAGGSCGLPAVAGGEAEWTAAYTLIGQAADDDRADPHATGSLDLFFGWSHRVGRLDAYVEGNSSPGDDTVAALIPESNADASTALSRDGSGRLQLSELKYTRLLAGGSTITGGLLDPAAYLDTTRIDNDENLQFLGTPFVNNPTIELPDYTLGVAARLLSRNRRREWHLFLSGSNGLGDNPDRSYGELVDLGQEDRGLFAGAEAAWTSPHYLIRAGAWWNGASHTTLDGGSDDAANYGVYATVGTSRGRAAANLRLGAARSAVSLASWFASISLQREWDRGATGLALACTGLSSHAARPDGDDGLALEAYARFDLPRALYLTPSVQYLVNPGFDASGSVVDDRVVVVSLRVHHVFIEK